MKTTAKTSKKNSSHKTKRAVLDVERWATVCRQAICVWDSEIDARRNRDPNERVTKVRITEVTK